MPRLPFLLLLQLWIVFSEIEPPCVPFPLTIPSTATTHAPQIIIAHRGASAHLPEHTLPAYRLALELGADYIEPDLVATQDNQLIAIHSMDLSITTDVAEKFPDRAEFSYYMNRTGYWSYNFQLEEIQMLKVRQRLPASRSTAFDGIFGIPTLTEILTLLQDWRGTIYPLLVNSTKGVRAKPGIYAELKDVAWVQEDKGVDLNDLLFQHMQEHADLWKTAIFDNLCTTKRMKIHEYQLAPFVLQCFEIKTLEMFYNRWHETFNGNNSNAVTTMPVPPTVLLVGREDCLDEPFWFTVGQSRNFLMGLGPDKSCLLSHEWRTFMARAVMLNLVVHPWTFRPELEYVGSFGETQFATVLEEIQYFFCTVKVQGVFSESVNNALLAANMECDELGRDATLSYSQNGTNPSATCSESRGQAKMKVGTAAFVMGVVLAIAMVFIGQRRHRQRHVQVPTLEQAADDLELT